MGTTRRRDAATTAHSTPSTCRATACAYSAQMARTRPVLVLSIALSSRPPGAPSCNSPDAVCCSVLQCVAVCCSVLQCCSAVPARCSLVQLSSCSELQCFAVCFSVVCMRLSPAQPTCRCVWPRICFLVQLTCCSVLHYVDLLQYFAVRFDVLQCEARECAPLCNSPVALCCIALCCVVVHCGAVWCRPGGPLCNSSVAL